MTWPVIVVVVLLLGLPLAAVWWSRRAFWTRLHRGRGPDPLGDVVREHRLGPAATARVEDAVRWGTRLADPRERAAVVQLARASLPRPGRWSRSPVVLVLVIGWAAAVVAFVAFAVAQGRWGDVNWFSIMWLLPAVWAGAAPHRAIRRNTD